MGGHCAEELFIGNDKITTGCGNDLQKATSLAHRAVESFGMFGEDAGYISASKKETSQERLALIDMKVKEILAESKARVTKMLTAKERQVRDISVNLYKYDYINKEEIEKIMNGKKLEKSNVREFDPKIDGYIIKF